MVETVRAELISTKERFNGIRLTEFQYTYYCDGKKFTDKLFNLVTADYDLEIVWTITRAYLQQSQNNNLYQCLWSSITLQESDKNFFGNLEIQMIPDKIFKAAFDTNSLPFSKDISPRGWCTPGCNINIKIQMCREYQASSLTVNLNDKLLEDKNFSDVIFIIGNEEIPACKKILSLHSDVFVKMFESDMMEKKTGRVEITDIEPAIFKLLLRSVYCGKLECHDADELFKLIVVADKYEIRNLVNLCAYRISDKVTVDNAIDILMLADQVRVEFLKKGCTDFIIANKDKIVGTESLKTWLNRDVWI